MVYVSGARIRNNDVLGPSAYAHTYPHYAETDLAGVLYVLGDCEK